MRHSCPILLMGTRQPVLVTWTVCTDTLARKDTGYWELALSFAHQLDGVRGRILCVQVRRSLDWLFLKLDYLETGCDKNELMGDGLEYGRARYAFGGTVVR